MWEGACNGKGRVMKQKQLWVLKNYCYIIILGMMCATGITALSDGTGFAVLLFHGMAVLSILFACIVSLMTINCLKKEAVSKDIQFIYLEVRKHWRYVNVVLFLAALLGVITFVLLPLTIVSIAVWISMLVQSRALKKAGGYDLYKRQIDTGQESVQSSGFGRKFELPGVYLYFVAVYLIFLVSVLPGWDADIDIDIELVFFVIATPVLVVLYIMLLLQAAGYFKSVRACEPVWLINENFRMKLAILPAVCLCVYYALITYHSNLFVFLWTCISVLTVYGISGKMGCMALDRLSAKEEMRKEHRCLLCVLQYIPFADVIASVYMLRFKKGNLW